MENNIRVKQHYENTMETIEKLNNHYNAHLDNYLNKFNKYTTTKSLSILVDRGNYSYRKTTGKILGGLRKKKNTKRKKSRKGTRKHK